MKNLIFVLLLIYTLPSPEQKWTLLDDNEKYTLYMRNNTKDSAWIKIEYKKVQIQKNIIGQEEKLKMELNLYKFDCNDKMMGTMAEIQYDDEGEVLRSDDNGKYPIMENVIPDTLGEKILLEYCKNK